jgi:hypothetical protein
MRNHYMINKNAFLCPHCNGKISVWEKMILDPRYKMKCKICKEYITISKNIYGFRILANCLTLIIIYATKDMGLLMWIILMIINIIIQLIELWFVPVVKRK